MYLSDKNLCCNRNLLGTFQFERDFTGCTNQTDIYPKDILNFDIPDLSLTEQENIVKEIQTQLNRQEELNQQITAKRQEISNIVEKSIREENSNNESFL